MRPLAITLMAMLAGSGAALAGEVGDRIAAAHTLRCAATERPGLLEDGEGLVADLCRAVARDLLGPPRRVEIETLDPDDDWAAHRSRLPDLLFLDSDELADTGLGDRLRRGPEVFAEITALMVPDTSGARSLRDLAGQAVCVMTASPGQRALEAAIARDSVPIARLAFQEDIEMLDAYNVGRCQAVAADASYLEAMQRDGGVNHRHSRVLTPPLATRPLLALTPANDPAWAARIETALRGHQGTPSTTIVGAPLWP